MVKSMSLYELMVKEKKIKPVALGYDFISCIVNQSVKNSVKCFFFNHDNLVKGFNEDIFRSGYTYSILPSYYTVNIIVILG